jgi:hypothetical protein
VTVLVNQATTVSRVAVVVGAAIAVQFIVGG